MAQVAMVLPGGRPMTKRLSEGMVGRSEMGFASPSAINQAALDALAVGQK